MKNKNKKWESFSLSRLLPFSSSPLHRPSNVSFYDEEPRALSFNLDVAYTSARGKHVAGYHK